MTEMIDSLISNPVTIVILLVAAIGWIIVVLDWFFVTRFKLKEIDPIRKDAQRIAETPSKIEKLDKDMARISTEVKNLSEKTDYLTTKIDNMPKEIVTYLGLPKPMLKTTSPLSLSEYGQELSDLMNASAITDKHKAKLIKEAKNLNMHAYQIQQSCFDFSKNLILEELEKEDKDQYNKLADIAFTEGIKIEELIPILGVLLRDQVFEAIGISLEEIDQEIRKPAKKI